MIYALVNMHTAPSFAPKLEGQCQDEEYSEEDLPRNRDYSPDVNLITASYSTSAPNFYYGILIQICKMARDLQDPPIQNLAAGVSFSPRRLNLAKLEANPRLAAFL